MELKNSEIIYYIAFGVSIALIIGGFFCPPMGVIDGSVLTACGILSAFVETHHFIKTGKWFDKKIEKNLGDYNNEEN